MAWLVERAFGGLKDQNFWWIGPNYAAVMTGLQILKSALTVGSYTQLARSSAMVLINGATIWFKSSESVYSLYSDSVSAAVVDNAVHIPEKSWEALRETLVNSQSPTRIVSTVAGRDNWFNLLARKAESEPTNQIGYSKFTSLDALFHNIISSDSISVAQSTLPSHIFRAMYLCEPYDDRVEAAQKAQDPRLMTDEELAIVAGLDPTMIATIDDPVLESITQENSYV